MIALRKEMYLPRIKSSFCRENEFLVIFPLYPDCLPIKPVNRSLIVYIIFYN